MKTKIIGICDSFYHFSLGQEINTSIKHLGDKMHELIIDDKKHIVEITKTTFVNNTKTIIEGLVSDNVNVGRIAVEFNY